MAASAILALHVLLLGGIGLATVFIGGIANYMGWILLGGFVLIGSGCYSVFRLMKRESRSLMSMMDSPMLSNRDVEVSLLGGFASIKISSPKNVQPMVGYDPADPQKRLESVKSGIPQENMKEMKGILERPHIMSDEYDVTSGRMMSK